MRIAIIEAGEPPAALVPEHGSYGAMIRALIGGDGTGGHDVATFRAFAGDLPGPGDCDAIVVSGSACGVHDGLPWIGELATLLRRAAEARRRLVGICFGHQVMAQTFGGAVARSPRGWGVGLHRYEIVAAEPWMAGTAAGDTIAVAASHQDQVVVRPPRTRLVAASAFAPHAMLAYADHPAMSVQFHPEFTPLFSRALLAARPWPGLSDEDRAAAIASHERASDRARVAGWIRAFLAG